MKLQNKGNVTYEVKGKKKDTMKLKDPHTGEVFLVHNIPLLLKLGEYRVVK